MRYDYDIPVTQAIRSLIHYHGKVDRYSTLTMAKTIARMLGIPEDDGYPALDSAWRYVPDEKLRFAKWYDSSGQIIALVNVHHEDYHEALESEAEVSRQRMTNESKNFIRKEKVLYEIIPNMKTYELLKVVEVIIKIVSARELKQLEE